MISLFGLDPGTYRRHPLHDPGRSFTETNCYTDILIELVHAAGHEPLAMLGSAVAVDFELDQWTFFKPSPEDVRRLYGIEIHEMQPYGGLPAQIAARLAAGQTLLPELDSYWLPDTAGMSYGSEHVKSSVVAESIDPDAGVFRYFHNAGYFELSGEDYRRVFRLDEPAGSEVLPPYTDLVRFDAGPVPDDPHALARDLLAAALTRRPVSNPFVAFGKQLAEDLPVLLAGDRTVFDTYAFANPRMAGAAFELLASHVRWLFGADGEQVAADAEEIVGGTKTLLFRLARRRTFDVPHVVEPLARAWDRVTSGLDALVG